MLSKLSLSIAGALALSAAAGGVARADPMPTSTHEAKPHSPTNDEINAAETGNPDSPDYRNRENVTSGAGSKAAWEALESASPDKAQSGTRSVLEVKPQSVRPVQ